MTRIMRDSDTPTAIRIHGTDLVAGYVTGPGKWPVKAYARFRGIPVAHIDCRGTMPKKAEILDVEPGCTGVHAAVTWVKKRKAVFPGAYPPIIYCDRSRLTPLRRAMNAAGLHLVKDFRLWVATLDGTKRLDDMTGVTAVQYKRAPNIMRNGHLEPPSEDITAGHYDESIVYDDDWHPEDDMPYTKKQILDMVKEGVAAELNARKTRKEILDLVKKGVEAELNASIGPSGVTPAQGAQAAVDAHRALNGIAGQLRDLNTLLTALQLATPPAAGTGTTAEPADGAAQPA